MEERSRKSEILVGIFLTVGLLLLGVLIMQFGNVRDIFKGRYHLTVTFPDGTGIKDGTPVILGGSRIGKVQGKPQLNETFNGVNISLLVYEHVKIPSDAQFSIGTSGLLGDSFIDVKTISDSPTVFIEPNTVIQGKVAGGLSGLQESAVQLSSKVDLALDDMRAVMQDLKVSVKNINEGALSQEAMNDLKKTMESLNQVVTRFDEKTFNEETSNNVKEAVQSFKNAAKTLEDATKKLDPAVTKIDGVVEQASDVMGSANKAMKSLGDTSASIQKTSSSIERVANDLHRGNGLLPALMHDTNLKWEFSNLISNLRQRGVLFYKDKSDVTPEPKPRRR